MLNLEALDPEISIGDQLGVEAAPVVLVNIFTVALDDVPGLLAAWEADARWMKRQPGYISAQLHRGIGDSGTFLNYAVWESVGHFRDAFSDPEFRNSLAAYPPSAVARPLLFSKVAVSNICTA